MLIVRPLVGIGLDRLGRRWFFVVAFAFYVAAMQQGGEHFVRDPGLNLLVSLCYVMGVMRRTADLVVRHREAAHGFGFLERYALAAGVVSRLPAAGARAAHNEQKI